MPSIVLWTLFRLKLHQKTEDGKLTTMQHLSFHLAATKRIYKNYLYDLTVKRSMNLNVVWIPREQNQCDDKLSKGCDYGDWENTDQLFSCTVDRLADNLKAK